MNTKAIIRCKSHEWVVFSMCYGTKELMLECVKCGAFGTVANPTREEWCKPADTPYGWHDADRVTIRKPEIASLATSGGIRRSTKGGPT